MTTLHFEDRDLFKNYVRNENGRIVSREEDEDRRDCLQIMQESGLIGKRRSKPVVSLVVGVVIVVVFLVWRGI